RSREPISDAASRLDIAEPRFLIDRRDLQLRVRPEDSLRWHSILNLNANLLRSVTSRDEARIIRGRTVVERLLSSGIVGSFDDDVGAPINPTCRARLPPQLSEAFVDRIALRFD